VLTAEDQLTFAEANEKSLLKQLDQAEKKFEVGLLAITDVHVARAQHDSAVAQTIQARNAVDTARENVLQIVGKNFGDLKKLRDPLPLDKPTPADSQAWVDLANKQNPTLLSAQKSVDSPNTTSARSAPAICDADRFDHAQRHAGLGQQRFYAYAGTGLGNPHNNSITGDTTIGVTLNIPIFSGGLVSSQTRQAVFQRDASQDQLELTRRTVVANTRNAYRAVISASPRSKRPKLPWSPRRVRWTRPGGLRSRHQDHSRRADQPGQPAQCAERVFAGAPSVRPQRPAAQAGGWRVQAKDVEAVNALLE